MAGRAGGAPPAKAHPDTLAPFAQALQHGQAHVDIAARGVGVRAHGVRLVHQRLGDVALQARQRDAQVDLDAEAGRDRADADVAGDRDILGRATLSRAATNFSAPRKQAE